MWPFKTKYHQVRINIRPLAGLGEDRKATLKFAKKFFGKIGNWEAVKTDIETARINGTFSIFAKIPAKYVKKLEKLQYKLGFDLEVSYDEIDGMGRKLKNIVKHYEDKKASWVVSSY